MKKISKKVLIIGASGRVGTELQRQITMDDLIAKPHDSLDIGDKKEVDACIKALNPDIVINTANQSKTDGDLYRMWATNVEGIRNLVNACAANGVPIVHLSQGDVFGGFYQPGPFNETDAPMCLSPYLQSKLAGEHAFLMAAMNRMAEFSKGFRYWLVRSSLLYASAESFSAGFVHELCRKAILRKQNVLIASDVVRSPTSIPHLVKHLIWLIENRRDVPCGVYHIANVGAVSLYDIAHFILTRISYPMTYQACTHAEQASSMGVSWQALAKSTPLNCDKWNRVCEEPLLDWRESMEEFLLRGVSFAK